MSTKQEIVERLMLLAPKLSENINYLEDYRDGYNSARQEFAERIAENAVVVNGHQDQENGEHQYGSGRHPFDTHTALLIDIQPLKKKDELVERLREMASSQPVLWKNYQQALLEAASRIEGKT